MYSRADLIVAAIAVPLAAAVTVGLFFLLRKKSKRVQLIPFIVITVIIIIGEIVKQAGSIANDYNLWHIPLHVCSIFLFTFPLAVFLKQGSRASNVFWAASLITGTLVSITLLFAPGVVIGGANHNHVYGEFESSFHHFIDLHTVVFHYLLLIFIVLAYLLRMYKPKLLEIIWSLVVFGVFLLLAAILANVLDVNYSSFLDVPFLLNAIRDSAAPTFVFQTLLWLFYMVSAVIMGAILLLIEKHVKKRTTS